MLVGGWSLLIAGLLSGETGLVHLEKFSTASLVSLLYLIVFGSVLAYTAYTWLLQNTTVSRVATYAYVNPLVAIVLGGVLLNEKIDAAILVGAVMIVISVVDRDPDGSSRQLGREASQCQATDDSPAATDREVSSPG